VVGLDIGSELIKVAEAKIAKDGIRITGLGIAPTPVGTIDNNFVVDPKGLGAAIKTLLKDSGIKTKTVVSSVSGQSSVVVRVIDVPKMTPEELTETMKWEVERHVPFSPAEIVMDFAPVEKPSADPNAQSMEVLLAVAQQGAVMAHVETLFAAGLQPTAIDVQPLAVSRPLVQQGNPTGPLAAAVVNIGANTTEVEVYEDGNLVFPGPPLPIAGINLTRAIAEAMGVSEDEAEMLKKEHGAADVTAMAQPSSDDTGFDFGTQDSSPVFSAFGDISAPAEPATAPEPPLNEPTEYNTSFQQADADFSPFDFGTPSPAPAAAEEPQAQNAAPSAPIFDISGDDVFDLGNGSAAASATGFTPSFDLDDPDPVAPASPSADFDLAGAAGSPADAGNGFSATDDSQFTGTQADPLATQSVVGTGTAQMVNQAIAPVLVELATEIRRSIDYYTSRYGSRPEQIFLCGGTAKLRDLDVFLSNELGIPVQIANPLGSVSVNCPKYTPQYLDEIAPLLPVSIGLAIRDMVG
jgi:type IV pilus assembly protein PilM